MGKLVKIPEAAQITDLSEYAIRTGVSQGRYPYIRTSGRTGKILIDIDLLKKCLEREALNNVNDILSCDSTIIDYGKLRQIKA